MAEKTAGVAIWWQAGSWRVGLEEAGKEQKTKGAFQPVSVKGS